MLVFPSPDSLLQTIVQLRHLESAVPESFCYELGSSWAMEVGGNLKVHSILVENLSKSGHMLVEVLLRLRLHF